MRFRSPPGTIGDAAFSTCGVYRYWLSRDWDASLPRIAFIGLNPSTADETNNDPTVLRCIRRAERLGYGSMVMLNAFAIRATDPDVMLAADEPVGPDNDAAIVDWCGRSQTILACWGNDGRHRGRDRAIVELVCGRLGRELHCLLVTGAGQPGHPLYLPYELKPLIFSPA